MIKNIITIIATVGIIVYCDPKNAEAIQTWIWTFLIYLMYEGLKYNIENKEISNLVLYILFFLLTLTIFFSMFIFPQAITTKNIPQILGLLLIVFFSLINLQLLHKYLIIKKINNEDKLE